MISINLGNIIGATTSIQGESTSTDSLSTWSDFIGEFELSLENNGDIRPWEKIRGLPGAWIKKSFIGNTRFKNKTAGADICFYWELRSKYHSEINLNKIIYRYNFPRKGSVSWGELHDKA